MRVSVPRERKIAERRVSLTPAGAATLTAAGHRVTVEAGAGSGIGQGDDAYLEAGAHIAADPEEVWGNADLVVKVKEPQLEEFEFLRSDLILFTYLHLAAFPDLAGALVRSGATAIGYETVTDDEGSLPLLAPMSEIAGRLAALAAAHHLQGPAGGPGLLISGSPGVPPAKVTVVGGGSVGAEAARVAAGMGARVTILERSQNRIRRLAELFENRVAVVASERAALLEECGSSDAVIGAVLVPGASAPKLLEVRDLATMRAGALLIDVAIDQGGCFASSRPTTHDDPVFRRGGVLHYCVGNMPGAVPITSTAALTACTFPFVKLIADRGLDGAVEAAPGLAEGINVRSGEVVHDTVAAALAEPASAPQ